MVFAVNSRMETTPIDGRWFGLDALRALAVLMVVVYHLNMAGIANGGFLGVDLFFVISGFLITSLLLAEHRDKGRIALIPFFVRRFHRLFPPFAAMVIVCTWMTPHLAPDANARLIADLPFAFYLSNWWQIYSQQSYFEGIHKPRIFQHLWSLAIEEQYYLIWPIFLGVLLRRWPRKTLGFVCLALALLSTLFMAYWYVFMMDGADPSRAYFGSDTHVMGLFIGAGLACFWNPETRTGVALDFCRNARLRVPLALWAISVLLWMGWNWHDQIPFIYQGGFALFSACSALVIVLVTDPAPVVQFKAPMLAPVRVLMHWTGTRSYSIYLWHWPIFIWINPQDVSDAWVVAERLLVTGLVAECSYRFIELQWKNAVLPGSRTRYSVAMALAFIASASYALHTYVPVPDSQPTVASASAEAASGAVSDEPAGAAHDGTIGSYDSYTRFDTEGRRTLVLGDSVMLGARGALLRAFPNTYVDAEVGRQASQGLTVLQQFFVTHTTPDLVVVHLGTNGYIYEKHFRQILEFLRTSTRVVVVNNYADRRWTAQNNELIQRVIADFDNVHLVDWGAIGHESAEYFVADGVHLSAKGMRRFVNAIGEALKLTGAPVAERKKSRPAAAVVPVQERLESVPSGAQLVPCENSDPRALPAACGVPSESVAAPETMQRPERE
jgi:peptidoglycan/LPS O-acetylase OafA/YrhL